VKTRIASSRFVFYITLLVMSILVLSACTRPQQATPNPVDSGPQELPEESSAPADQSEAVQAALDMGDQANGVFLFYDDFQDGLADNWETVGAWFVEQSGDLYILGAAGRGYAWVPSGHNWADYAFHAGVRLESGALFLSMNLTQEGRYLLRLDENAVYLLKEQPAGSVTILAETGPVSMSEGHSIVMAAHSGNIQVYVDEQLWMDATDPSPISIGTIGVSSLDDSRVGVDNIYVLQLSAPLPTGEVVSAPPVIAEPIPAEELAAEVADLPLAEMEPEEEAPPPVVEPGALPDLVAGNVVFDPDPVIQGQAFQTVFNVTNQGNAAAGAFTVRMHFHAATALVDCNLDFPGLASGETGMGFCNGTTNANPGTSPTEFGVDVENEITESDESNNQATPTLTVVAGESEENGDGEEVEPLLAPVNCGASALSSSEVSITWNVPGGLNGHQGFRVYQGEGSLEDQVADPTFRSLTIGDLEPGVQYHFDVRTYNASSESPVNDCAVDVTTDSE